MFPDLIKEPSNIVKLTYREHYICHWLLYKIYEEQDDKNAMYKMLYAWFRLCKNTDGIHLTSREFELAKLKISSLNASEYGRERSRIAAKNMWASFTKEEKAEFGLKISDGNRRYWKNISAEEYEDFCRKAAERNKKRYEDPLERKKANDNLRRAWANMSDEEKKIRNEKVRQSKLALYANMSDEERLRRNKQVSIATKKAMANLSPEKKQKMIANLKHSMFGYKWFNNGIKEKFCLEPPDGFVKGRLKRRKL